MKRPFGLTQCEVPGCVRSVGKEPGFCARCWLQMTDGEQAMLRFSRHAPFWPRYMPYDDDPEQLVKTHPAGARPPGAAVGVYSRGGFLFTDDGPGEWQDSLGYRLREYEARTTQAAIAQIVGDRLSRRYSESVGP